MAYYFKKLNIRHIDDHQKKKKGSFTCEARKA